MSIISKSIEWGGKELTLQTGKIAKQADASVVVTCGKLAVLCTVSISRDVSEKSDFMPLTVNFAAKGYALGKIPGGFFKREGKAMEQEILISRIVDRSFRPIIPSHIRNDIQISCVLLSSDRDVTIDAPTIIGVSAALKLAGLITDCTVAAAKIGYENGEAVLSVARSGSTENLNLVVAGTRESVFMIEAAACELPNEEMAKAIAFAHEQMLPVIDFIDTFVAEADEVNNQDDVFLIPEKSEDDAELYSKVLNYFDDRFFAVFTAPNKKSFERRMERLVAEALQELANDETTKADIIKLWQKALKQSLRDYIIKNGQRPDGRKTDEIRNITSETEILPGAHGSSLFTRGDTQSLAVVTLGGSGDEQIIECIETSLEVRDKFILHYNFWEFCVAARGPAKSFMKPNRREVGHGHLAKKAFNSILPSKNEFPYTIRVVSEITESDGSSSMATVCSSSLALMDAGVPLKSAVAGIAMGLIKDGDNVIILSDITGTEDQIGDMDFKITSTAKGVTALQMDIKTQDLDTTTIAEALRRATEGCMHILAGMQTTLSEHRSVLRGNVPSLISFMINKERIGSVIGPKGKTIKEICEKYGVKIDVSPEGKISVSGTNADDTKNAREFIEKLTEGNNDSTGDDSEFNRKSYNGRRSSGPKNGGDQRRYRDNLDKDGNRGSGHSPSAAPHTYRKPSIISDNNNSSRKFQYNDNDGNGNRYRKHNGNRSNNRYSGKDDKNVGNNDKQNHNSDSNINKTPVPRFF